MPEPMPGIMRRCAGRLGLSRNDIVLRVLRLSERPCAWAEIEPLVGRFLDGGDAPRIVALAVMDFIVERQRRA